MIFVLRLAAKVFSYKKAKLQPTEKKLEEVVFVEEEFLYKKIGKKDVYVHYGATADIPQEQVTVKHMEI